MDRDVVTAIASVAVALVLAALVDRALGRHPAGLPALRPEARTRLRFLRRVIAAVIILIGVSIALSQFSALDRVAAAFLASGAITAAIVGFAARTTLANAIAGLLIAITQPLRVGDQVSFEGNDGEVEDVRLTYTYLRTGAGARVVIPNERLAAGILRNDTILDPEVAAEADVWLAAETDANAAVEAVRAALPEASVTLAELTAEGTRLHLVGEKAPVGTRAPRADALRTDAYTALRARGLR